MMKKMMNKNPKIFIVSGKARSGKDLVSDLICDYYKNKKCKKLSYAYYLKQYVKDITGWDGSEETKPRDILQQVGIELIKEKISDTFLIDRIIEDIKIYSYFYDIIIITDARLVNEIKIPKENFDNVITIRVNKNADNRLTDIQKKHITETGLDNYSNFDYIIDNNGSYKELVDNLNKILKEVTCIK